MSTTVPTITFNTAGNLRASASLAANTSATADIDASAVMLARIATKLTMGGTVAATAGLKIEAYPRFGSAPTDTDGSLPAQPNYIYTMPAGTASQVSYCQFALGPGKWRIKITNLDVTNAVTVEQTADTMVLTTT